MGALAAEPAEVAVPALDRILRAIRDQEQEMAERCTLMARGPPTNEAQPGALRRSAWDDVLPRPGRGGR